ncbi:glycosyltransferase family 39 protein [Micromonospora sp. NBC_01699]|uniref:glycosyltransferase family 39 protein n=1 Tax=Micromonospora sp. NBC_01699 TaxID=2975984 RepID=UPI002E2EA761|nr:glycosyltransferase family 39 protein [Micromonospora sp. NBC_01699]
MNGSETLPTTAVPAVPEAAPTPDGQPTPATAPTGSPAWVRPALGALLLATALLYLYGLGDSGWANSFYSAAAQAGSASWKALFYGSSDAANSITVDKPPAALWLMALSVRVFGLNPWAILVPQALAGVASVGVLFATVRRWYGPAAGLLAGTVLAVTPVATLMFRFNNPDALLVLLLVLGAYATVRAVETAGTRWIVLAGVLVGFGFLTKMLQAFLVVPVFAVVYLVAAPTGVPRRIRQLLLAGLGLVVAAGWWVAIVQLVPASARPYVGGSQGNSILELTLGYNGLGRITGEQPGSVGGGGGGPGGNGGGWGDSGWLRLFGADLAGQIGWLLPAALILLVVGLVVAGRAPRTDRGRAGFLLWGGWLLVTGVTFSLMQGIFHAYYSVALAPAVAALVGMGATVLWRLRRHRAALPVLAGVLAVTAGWSWVLLGRSAQWQSWLRPTVLIAGLVAAVLLALLGWLTARVAGSPGSRWAAGAVLALGVLAALAGPVGYSIDTAATAHAGAIPSAGPAAGGAGFGGRGGPGGGRMPGGAGGPFAGGGNQGAFPGAGGPAGGNQGAFPGGGNRGGAVPGGGTRGGAPGATVPRGAAGGPGGGMGGLLDARTPSAEMVALLKQDRDRYTWVAATIGSNNAAGYQLATGDPVMAIGGFNGSDPSPTLARFQEYVRAGKIHYYLGGQGFRANGGSQAAQEIATWVTGNFTASTVDGTTVYDLSTGREG